MSVNEGLLQTMKFIRIYFLCFILWEEILAVHLTIRLERPSATNYFHELVNYLKNKSKLHQVVFILKDQFNNANSMMNSFIKTVDTLFRHSPTAMMKF